MTHLTNFVPCPAVMSYSIRSLQFGTTTNKMFRAPMNDVMQDRPSALAFHAKSKFLIVSSTLRKLMMVTFQKTTHLGNFRSERILNESKIKVEYCRIRPTDTSSVVATR
jgi:hypothetical protein